VLFKTLSTKNSTLVTAVLSLALAVILVVPETKLPAVGAVMATVGGTLSVGGGGGGGGGVVEAVVSV
jgi:phytoene dehydrogenase-like protein